MRKHAALLALSPFSYRFDTFNHSPPLVLRSLIFPRVPKRQAADSRWQSQSFLVCMTAILTRL